MLAAHLAPQRGCQILLSVRLLQCDLQVPSCSPGKQTAGQVAANEQPHLHVLTCQERSWCPGPASCCLHTRPRTLRHCSRCTCLHRQYKLQRVKQLCLTLAQLIKAGRAACYHLLLSGMWGVNPYKRTLAHHVGHNLTYGCHRCSSIQHVLVTEKYNAEFVSRPDKRCRGLLLYLSYSCPPKLAVCNAGPHLRNCTTAVTAYSYCCWHDGQGIEATILAVPLPHAMLEMPSIAVSWFLFLVLLNW